MDLNGKHILITGGARVGQFVAQELLAAGAKISMTYLKEASEAHSEAVPYQADLTNEASIHAFWTKITTDAGQVDGLVNMVSLFTRDEAALTFDAMHKTFAVNAFGNMLVSRLFAEAAKERGEASSPIVSFIDWAVDHPYSTYGVYLAAKAALRHYLMALQTTFAGSIRVVNIHPGMILEPSDFPAAEKETIIDNTPTRAIGTPEQAAKLVRTALEIDYLADNIRLAGGQQWRHRLQ